MVQNEPIRFSPLYIMNLLEKIEIIDAGSEGNAVARHGDMVVFVPFGVPGDVVDIDIFKS